MESFDSVIIIAEAGVNHNGDRNKAEEMIRVAAYAGVDYIKFQSFNTDKLVSKEAKKADYQSENVDSDDDSQYNMLKALELSDDDHHFLMKKCQKHGIKFLSTPFDADGIDYLNDLGVSIFKSPSGEITNYPYLKRLGEIGKPVILSTGMASLKEVIDAVEVMEQFGLDRKDIAILHCNTEYPTPMKDVNLKAMDTIAEELNVQTGYSDHTLGIEIPVAAVARGAKIIEKHFTLDRTLPGPDHRASLEPDELKEMVKSIRNVEQALAGDGVKEPSESERKNIDIVRKSIHLRRSLSANDRICEEDLIPLRPADGISPMEFPNIIGKKVNEDLEKFHQLKWDNLTESD